MAEMNDEWYDSDFDTPEPQRMVKIRPVSQGSQMTSMPPDSVPTIEMPSVPSMPVMTENMNMPMEAQEMSERPMNMPERPLNNRETMDMPRRPMNSMELMERRSMDSMSMERRSMNMERQPMPNTDHMGEEFLYDPKFYAFLIIILIIAYGSHLIIKKSIDEGYLNSLILPSWAPSPAVIATIWITLYFLIAYSTYRAYHYASGTKRRSLLILFAIQIFINFMWGWVFFGLKNPNGAFTVILLLLVAIFLQMIFMYYIDPMSAYIFAPYFIWVVFVAFLNNEIIKLNN